MRKRKSVSCDLSTTPRCVRSLGALLQSWLLLERRPLVRRLLPHAGQAAAHARSAPLRLRCAAAGEVEINSLYSCIQYSVGSLATRRRRRAASRLTRLGGPCRLWPRRARASGSGETGTRPPDTPQTPSSTSAGVSLTPCRSAQKHNNSHRRTVRSVRAGRGGGRRCHLRTPCRTAHSAATRQ